MLLASILAPLLVACAPDHPAAVVGVRASGCTPVAAEGSGAFVAPGTVLTAAHTVAGATTIEIARSGGVHAAELVALDPANDLALLRVGDRSTAPLVTATAPPSANTSAVAYVWRGGAVRRIDVTIVRPIVISTTDVYREAAVDRSGYELAGTIVPGDSGAPLLVGGRIVGVIWARSNVSSNRAYAIDVRALAPGPTAELARCASTPP